MKMMSGDGVFRAELEQFLKANGRLLLLKEDGSFTIKEEADHIEAFDYIENSIEGERIVGTDIENITKIEVVDNGCKRICHHLGYKVTITTEVIV